MFRDVFIYDDLSLTRRQPKDGISKRPIPQITALFLTLAFASPLRTDPPPVVTDIAPVQSLVAQADVVCLFGEPQFNPTRAQVAARDLGLKLDTLDPVGADLEPGAALYGELPTGLAECLTPLDVDLTGCRNSPLSGRLSPHQGCFA
ncbi:hypothetical protein [Pseudooceanicola sp.]|uniref:hypothetical protein n=1 Tax=Pseudooceanicola sp. TaxID=1914328 RepID=UPI0026194276|nr:hypothetical protein [Pseudooceanicola sp.]MDF1857016.1 hypothetical protein [Pseudooceanicola sp.]